MRSYTITSVALLTSLLIITQISAQDVPISITAITANELGDVGSLQIDLSSLANLSLGSSHNDGTLLSNNSGQSISIRGFGGPVASNLIITGSLGVNNQVLELELVEDRTSVFGMNARAGVLRKLDFIGNTFYGGVDVGYETVTTKTEFEQGSSDFSLSQISYGAQVGKFSDVGEAIVYTSVDYHISSVLTDDIDEQCNTFGFNANLVGAATCGEIDLFHKDNGGSYNTGKTDQGAAFLEGNTGLWFSAGSLTSTYNFNGDSFESTENKSSIELAVGGGYYLTNGLAGLFNTRYGRSGESPDDSDDSQSNSEFAVRLGVQAHLDLFGAEKLNNLYVAMSGEFGSQGSSSEFAGQSTSVSEGFTNFSFSAGVNHHITNSLFLTPYASYNIGSFADSDLTNSELEIGFKFRQMLCAPKGEGE